MKFLKLNRAILLSLFLIPIAILSVFDFQNHNAYIIVLELTFISVFIWLVFLNSELMKRIPKRIDISDKLFLVNLYLIFISASLFSIFAESGKDYEVTGIAALPFFYYLYAVFQIINHLSKILTCVEEGREVPWKERIPEIIALYFFYIGIWWLQPRIIKALEKPVVLREKYISIKEREAMKSAEAEIKNL